MGRVYGYLQVDGNAGYHSTEAKRVGCMAHARCKFEEARNANVGKVVWALSLTQKLYRIEKACQGCPPEDKNVYRQRPSESLPLMPEFGQWLSKTVVLPKGSLGKTIIVKNNGAKLMRYLEDGRLSIDNNRAERAIKPVHDRMQELVMR